MKKMLLIIFVVLFLVVLNTDLFQRKLFPRKYWGKEVKRIENVLNIMRVELENQKLKDKQFRINYETEYEIKYNTILSSGFSKQEAKDLATSFMNKEEEKNRFLLEFFEDSAKDSGAELGNAELKYKESL